MLPKISVYCVIFCIIFPLTIINGELCMGCGHKTVHRMLTADCYDRKLREVPKCLRTNVEVMELTFNRIREIKKDDLNRYNKVKILYLGDNMISKIDDSAIAGLTSLISLDLSINSLVTLPVVIFHLPSLRKLYISQNQNVNIAEVINNSRPITSPLEHLDISSNELDELPEIGPLPTLVTYNISGNHVRKFSLKNIAGLCNLQKLINDNFTAEYENLCDCWKLTKWMRSKNIRFTSLNCPVSEDACTEEISENEISDYHECEEKFNAIVLRKRLLSVALPICATILVVVIAVIFFFYRKKRRKIVKNRKKIFENKIISVSNSSENGNLIK